MVTTRGLTPSSRFARSCITLTLALIGYACTADDATLVSPLDDSRRESLAIEPAYFDVIEGQTLPLSITQNGAPLTLSDVVWSVTPAWAATIDDRGVLTALDASPVAVRASLRGLQASVSGTVHGEPVALTSDDPVLQSGYAGRTAGDSIVVQVTSDDGSPVPGVDVSFSSDGSGSLSHTVRSTDAEGQARVAWTLGTTPRLETLTARVDGIEPVHFQVDVGADAATSVVHVVSGGDQEAEAGEALPDPIVVQIRDAYENPVSELGVQWIFPSGEGAAPELFDAGQMAGTATTVTDASGTTAVRWRLGTEAGDQEVAILLMLPDSETGTGASARRSGKIRTRSRAGVPRKIRVNPTEVSMKTGESVALSASVTDRYGNAVDTATVTWRSEQTQIATVDTQGRVSGRSAGTTQIRATSNGYSAIASATVTETAAAQLKIHSGHDQSGAVGSGLPEALVIQSLRTDGTPIQGTSLTWTVSSGSGSLQGTTFTTDHNGAARAAWVLGTEPGTHSVTVSDGANSVRFTASASPGPVAALVLRPEPATVDEGDKLAFQAVARDAFGNSTTWQSIAWASNDATVASVDGFGLVSGKRGGMAQIEATADGVRMAAPVEVKAIAPPPAPSILIMTPSTGPTTGGTAVALSGSNFQAGAAVRFGGTSAVGVSVQSAGVITASAPAGPVGTVDVIVTNPDGRADTLRSAFTYQAPAPAPVASLSVTPDPASVDEGATVTLSASALDASGNATTWQSIAWTSSNTSVATVDAQGKVSGHQPGWAYIQATADGVKAGAEVQVKAVATPPTTPAPVLADVTPGSGPISGGTAVTVRGTGFQTGAVLSFGGTVANAATVVSDTMMTALTPPASAGIVTVEVVNPDGQRSGLTNSFTYLAPAPSGPIGITSLSRDVGSSDGGTRVTLTTTGVQSGARVWFGGSESTSVEVHGPTRIIATAPRHTPALVDVTVTNPDQGTSSRANAFEYLPGPTTTYREHNFEDGTLGPYKADFAAPTVVDAGSIGAVSGSRIVRARKGAVGNGSSVLRATSFTPTSPPHTPTGVYFRWFQYIPQSTLTMAASDGAQVKLLLNRAGQGSWLQNLVGGQANGHTTDELVALADEISFPIVNSTGFVTKSNAARTGFRIPPDTWVEYQVWYHHDGTRGYARMWVNGKEMFNVSDVALGHPSGDGFDIQLGTVYVQGNSTGIDADTYLDDVTVANGYINR